MNYKIQQIAVAPFGDRDCALFVLAENKLFQLDYTVEGNWRPLPLIPDHLFSENITNG
jgi:hypothetical protein